MFQWDTSEVPGITDPFDNSTLITEIQPTETVHLVRLYNTASGSTKGGAWLMFSQSVRGMTAAQLRDVFALPNVPDTIVSVDIPVSPNIDPQAGPKYGLWTGIAGPIWQPGYYWGKGGAIQVRVISDFNGTHYFPDYLYAYGNRYHEQPIGVQALLYEPMAGGGNAQSVAAYLDQFIPVTYSDMYDVYTDLDYLNWNNPAVNTQQDLYTCYFRQALRSISPERYEALLFVAMRNGLLFGNAILEQHLHTVRCGESSCDDECRSEPYGFWAYGVGEAGDYKPDHCLPGFKYHTGGVVCCADWQPCNDLIVGVGLAGLFDSLKWHHGGGKAHGADVKLGAYVHYAPSRFFIDGIVSGGRRWTSARRSVVFNAIDSFAGLDRCARSHQKGYDLEVHVQSGVDIAGERCAMTPLARISYFLNKQKHFTECGADSLDLAVNGFRAGTLRAYIGSEFSRTYKTECACVMPSIHAAWARDVATDNRVITSNLIALGGCFPVNGAEILGTLRLWERALMCYIRTALLLLSVTMQSFGTALTHTH